MDVSSGQRVDPPLPRLPDLPATRSKRGSQFSWHMLLMGLGLAIAAKTLGPWWIAGLFQAVKLSKPTGLTALLTAVAAAIVLHEFGHLIAAILLDFEILGGALGPFRFTRSHREWTVQFRPKALFSGSVTAIPRNRNFWRKRMVVVVAAGPAATLVSGVCAACVSLQVPLAAWPAAFINLFAQISFLLFFLGLLPNSPRAPVRNDARLFLALMRNTPEAQEILLYHLVAQLEIAGLRPRDYPDRLIRTLSKASGRPDMCLVYAHTILLWAIDRGDLPAAEAWEQRTMELSEISNPRLRNVTLASSACFDVLFRNDLESAGLKFDQVDFDTIAPLYLMHRLRAAERIARRRIPDALAHICSAQYYAPKHLPYYEFERSLLGRLHAKAITMPAKELVPQ